MGRRAHVFAIVATVLLGACGGGGDGAGDRLDAIREAGELVVGVRTDDAPFATEPAPGEREGFEVAIGERLASCIDVSPRFVTVAAGERIPLIQNGQVDVVIATMGVSVERAEEVAFSIPYLDGGVVVMVPDDSPIVSLGDLAGRRVAAAEGQTADAIALLTDGVTLVTRPSHDAAFVTLRRGNADAMAADLKVITDFLANGDYRVLPDDVTHLPIAVATALGEDELLGVINVCLETFRGDAWDTAYDRWLGPLTGLDAPADIAMPPPDLLGVG